MNEITGQIDRYNEEQRFRREIEKLIWPIIIYKHKMFQYKTSTRIFPQEKICDVCNNKQNSSISSQFFQVVNNKIKPIF